MLVAGFATFLASSAIAEPVKEADAARHFDRGYDLAQQGRLEEAITEFKRAYELQPHPLVLYNLAQSYATSGRAVDAIRSLRKYLVESGPEIDAGKRRLALALIEHQQNRVGLLAIEVSPPGSDVALDGEPLGQTPLKEAVEATAGVHAVTISHAGYVLQARRVQLMAKSMTQLSVELEREPSAHLFVDCTIPDVAVSSDERSLGRLSLGGERTIPSGPQTIRFQRPGYLPAERHIQPGAGEVVRLRCALGRLDPRAWRIPARVEASASARATLDGEPLRVAYIAEGRHQLGVFAPGRVPAERLLEVSRQRRTTTRVELEEPPTVAVAREQRARVQRTWAWITAAASAGAFGTALALFVANRSDYSQWRTDSQQLAKRLSSDPESVSVRQLDGLLARENELRNRDVWAVGLGALGAGLAATSTALWWTLPSAEPSGITLHIGSNSWVGYTRAF